ncbi:hypothetical protein BDY19DRAFT_905139 [Irpex rosettiformis]|uniref:Uncharacterized protein n=1 Tax=Irpex rosettiformis TaxID=378272 RepID=A0ACB8U6V2_9APHY|nr:hypothetical protein BDY19DRAFT_905139 [Irpex rosettiformis]
MSATSWTSVPPSEAATYWRSLYLELISYPCSVTGDFLEIAATALFFYEYFLILPDEVKYIWKLKKSIASYLFIVNRYVVLCVRGFRLVQMVSWEGRNEVTADEIQDFTIPPTVFASLRTYAIWEKNRIVLICVLILGLIYPCGFTYSITTRDYRAAPPPFTGCDYDTSLNLSIGLDPNMIYMVFEATVVVLTWTKTFTLIRRRRQINGRIDQGMGYILLRDGTIHFTTLVILNVIGLITFVSTPFDFISPLTDTMISVLISRLILNLRQDFMNGGNEGGTTVQWTTTLGSPSGDGRRGRMARGGGVMDDVSNVTVMFARDVNGNESWDGDHDGEHGRWDSDGHRTFAWEMSESSGGSSPATVPC